jgi:hypothetical protein
VNYYINSTTFDGTAHNKAYPRRSEYLTWASPHCAKGRATSGKQDVMWHASADVTWPAGMRAKAGLNFSKFKTGFFFSYL